MPNGQGGANWRQLVSGAMATDVARERTAGSALGNVLKRLMAEVKERGAETRKGAQRGRELAQTALYSKRPELAAQHLGVEYPKVEVGAPPGLVPSKWTDPNTDVTYELPEEEGITARQLGGWYTKYATDVRAANAEQSWMVGRKGFESYAPTSVPTFNDWVKENFPEYAGKLKVATEGEEEMSDEDLNAYLDSQGFEPSAKNRATLRRNMKEGAE